ncbi:hypothetical protein VTO73DRAFT_3306 [Trametes versicolor]
MPSRGTTTRTRARGRALASAPSTRDGSRDVSREASPGADDSSPPPATPRGSSLTVEGDSGRVSVDGDEAEVAGDDPSDDDSNGGEQDAPSAGDSSAEDVIISPVRPIRVPSLSARRALNRAVSVSSTRAAGASRVALAKLKANKRKARSGGVENRPPKRPRRGARLSSGSGPASSSRGAAVIDLTASPRVPAAPPFTFPAAPPSGHGSSTLESEVARRLADAPPGVVDAYHAQLNNFQAVFLQAVDAQPALAEASTAPVPAPAPGLGPPPFGGVGISASPSLAALPPGMGCFFGPSAWSVSLQLAASAAAQQGASVTYLDDIVLDRAASSEEFIAAFRGIGLRDMARL